MNSYPLPTHLFPNLSSHSPPRRKSFTNYISRYSYIELYLLIDVEIFFFPFFSFDSFLRSIDRVSFAGKYPQYLHKFHKKYSTGDRNPLRVEEPRRWQEARALPRRLVATQAGHLVLSETFMYSVVGRGRVKHTHTNTHTYIYIYSIAQG